MNMEKMVMVMAVVVMGMAIISQVVQAAVPQPQYTCPIDGEKFMTYDELYNHFTTSHPAEPIEIIWG